MSSLRELVFDRCTGHAGTAALVGTRCYPDRLPENVTLPAVSFVARISEADELYRTHDLGKVPRAVARVQLNAYAETGDGADALATQLVDAWSGYQDGCDIGGAQIAGRVDTYEQALNYHRAIVDVLVDYMRE